MSEKTGNGNETGLASFPGACEIERKIRIDFATREQRYWRSKDFNDWDQDPRSFKGKVAIGGSLRGTAGMSAACAWAVVLIDLDGGNELWY